MAVANLSSINAKCLPMQGSAARAERHVRVGHHASAPLGAEPFRIEPFRLLPNSRVPMRHVGDYCQVGALRYGEAPDFGPFPPPERERRRRGVEAQNLVHEHAGVAQLREVFGVRLSAFAQD